MIWEEVFFYFLGLLDIVSIFDFIEGVDMSFDFEVELCVVMEGLDDLVDVEESGDKRILFELEFWW